MRITILFIVFLLQGCIILPKTHFPDVNLKVMDKRGNPIEKADISIATLSWNLGGYQAGVQDYKTDGNGNLRIDGQSSWENFWLIADGNTYLSWAVCVSAHGYQPYINNKLKSSRDEIVIHMSESTDEAICKATNSKEVFSAVAITKGSK